MANNNYFIKKINGQNGLNKQYAEAINALVEKDKLHDAKDAELSKLIEGFKVMAKAVQTTENEEK